MPAELRQLGNLIDYRKLVPSDFVPIIQPLTWSEYVEVGGLLKMPWNQFHALSDFSVVHSHYLEREGDVNVGREQKKIVGIFVINTP